MYIQYICRYFFYHYVIIYIYTYFVMWRHGPTLAVATSFTRYLDDTPQSVELLWTNDQLVAETIT
jgi:hypothetical protein